MGQHVASKLDDRFKFHRALVLREFGREKVHNLPGPGRAIDWRRPKQDRIDCSNFGFRKSLQE